MDLAEVVRRHGPAYLERYGARLPRGHRAALEAILRCHTPECGGSLYHCASCGRQRFVYHRCSHRACSQCGRPHAEAWRQRQQERLLPTAYFLLTFTVPEVLRALLRSHQRVLYGALFSQSAAAVQDLARQPRYLGGELGMLGVLHTWTRQLAYHPHVHYLVPAVALCEDGALALPKDPEFLLPVHRLSARFRNRFKAWMREEAPELYRQVAESTWRAAWVVHSQYAARGSQALAYLSGYIQKTAISSARILSQDAQSVTFSYRQSGTNAECTLRLPAQEFLRRFLEHVLPKGFRRVRSYGLLSPAAIRRFEQVAALLGALCTPKSPRPCASIVIECPCCRKPMRRIAEFGRGPP